FVAAFDGEGINFQIWPPSDISWFAIGMLAAEFEGRVKISSRIRPFAWLLAAATLWIASREWFGPPGLVHPEPGEFNRRILAGAVFAACIVVRYALGRPSRILESTTWQFLGKISYPIFLWHVAILGLMFPLTGISLFSGHFILIFILTVAFTIAVSYASYELVEEPARRYFHGRTLQATAAAAKAANSEHSHAEPADGAGDPASIPPTLSISARDKQTGLKSVQRRTARMPAPTSAKRQPKAITAPIPSHPGRRSSRPAGSARKRPNHAHNW